MRYSRCVHLSHRPKYSLNTARSVPKQPTKHTLPRCAARAAGPSCARRGRWTGRRLRSLRARSRSTRDAKRCFQGVESRAFFRVIFTQTFETVRFAWVMFSISGCTLLYDTSCLERKLQSRMPPLPRNAAFIFSENLDYLMHFIVL